MFSSLKKKINGVLTESALKKKSNIYFDEILEDSENALAHSIKNNNLKDDWDDWHNKHIANIAKADNRYEQIIELRKAVIEQIEEISFSKAFVTDDYSDDEKDILIHAIDGEQESASARTANVYRYIYAKTSFHIFRYIALELDDAADNDWTDFYSEISDTYADLIYKRLIKTEKEEESALDEIEDAVINTLEQRCAEVKKEVINGGNYEFNREEVLKEEQQKREQEEQKDRELKEEEESKRMATTNITNSQIEDLTEFMIERYSRINNGELYNIEDYSPVNTFGAIEVDSGIMLIALSECVADIEIAKKALRKVMWNLVKEISKENLDGKDFSDVSIDVAEVILGMKQDEGSWLSDVVILTVQYLYDITLSDYTEEEQKEIGRYSTSMVDDAWKVFANTKNVFGYELNTDSMFSD